MQADILRACARQSHLLSQRIPHLISYHLLPFCDFLSSTVINHLFFETSLDIDNQAASHQNFLVRLYINMYMLRVSQNRTGNCGLLCYPLLCSQIPHFENLYHFSTGKQDKSPICFLHAVLQITEPQQNEPTNTKDDECCGLFGTLVISPWP